MKANNHEFQGASPSEVRTSENNYLDAVSLILLPARQP